MFIIDLFEKEEFSIDAFHGTGGNFDAFEYNKNARGNSGAREAGIGFWFTNNPETASEFAHWSSRGYYDGGQVLPVKLKINHPLILDTYAKLKDIVDEYTTFARPGHIVGDRNIRMVQDKTDFEKLRHDLKSKGYDGIIIKNTLTDSPDGKTPIDQYIIFDGSQARSRFAKFDSTKKDSTNLLDSISYQVINEALNVEMTAKRFGPQLIERANKDPSFKRSRELFLKDWKPFLEANGDEKILMPYYEWIVKYFADFDPTPQKKYLINWIIPKYLSGGISYIEDLDGVYTDLVEFDKHKKYMKVKDIFQIKTATDLSTVVRESLVAAGMLAANGRFIPNDVVEDAMKHSLILLDNAEWTIAIPFNETAAGFWGRESEWCTAYGFEYGINPTKTSYYNQYNDDGARLLIFFDKSGNKKHAQLYYAGQKYADDIQLMNNDDNDLSEKQLYRYIQLIPKDKYDVIKTNCLAHYNFDENGRILKIFGSVSDCIDEIGNDTIKNCKVYIIDGEPLDGNYTNRDLDDIIDSLPDDLDKKLRLYISKQYPEEFHDKMRASEIKDILEEYEDDEIDLIDALKQADYNAQSMGAEEDMYEHFKKALSNANVTYTNYDSACNISASIEDFLENPNIFGENAIDMTEPYYGFSGYNKDAFENSDIESILDEKIEAIS